MSASSKKKLRKEQNAAQMTERQQKEQAEAKSLKTMTTVFVAIMAVVVCVFLVTQVISGVNRSGVIEKNTIALTVGDKAFNTVTMNYYFYDTLMQEYNTASNTYGDSTTYYFKSLGLDLTKPLNKQVRDEETGETWADYYWAEAVKNAKSDYALYQAAVENNFEMPEDMQANIDNTMMSLQLEALMAGASGTEEYLRAKYGQGSTEESYKEYVNQSALAYAYYNNHADSLKYDNDAIKAYNDEHYNDFSAYSFSSYYLSYASYLPQGVTASTATDEQLAAAREAVKAAALSLANCTTTAEFDAAIKALSINKDSTTAASTLNTDVMHTSLVEDYAEWLSDSERKVGDMKVFSNTTTTTDADGNETKVVNSYDVFMFQGRNDNLRPLANVRHLLVKFQGGTTTSSGTTYSETEKATAKNTAAKYLMEYLNGERTEERFIELVKKYSEDTSKDTGGLFEDIHRESSYVTSFRNWAVDPSREVGDVEMIESEYGYHIMYYSSDDELTFRDYMITNVLRSDDLSKWHDDLTEPLTATEGDLGRVNFGLVFQNS